MRRNKKASRVGTGKKGKYIWRCIYVVLLAGLLGAGAIGYWRNTLYQSQDKPQYEREDTEFHLLPADKPAFTEPPEQIEINDRSLYAGREDLSFYQYTCRNYNEDMAISEISYDRDGRLSGSCLWEYDTAGNIRREWSDYGTDREQMRGHSYEYDSSGRIAHEAVSWNGKLIEDNYFRYTDMGRAGVSYSYLNDQVDGGISQYCHSHTEFLEDEDGNPQYVFYLTSLASEIPGQVWKMQWIERGERMINRIQYFNRNYWMSDSREDWYRYAETADEEQINLYEYNTETKTKNQVLQLNYEWQREQEEFHLMDSFYRARYDGDLLLWKMVYSDNRLTYYNACQYDADGKLQVVVEYEAEEEEQYPCTMLHYYAYPEKDREEEYSYYIQGQEFRQSFGNGDNVCLIFDEWGTLSEIEMTDAAGNVSEKYEFYVTGRDYGKLKTMYSGAEEIAGEEAILAKMEEEAQVYGVRVGADLESNTEGSAE